MKASRELDRLVAEKVMGYWICDELIHSPMSTPDCDIKKPGHLARSHCKPYSPDISAAWEVVEKMKESYLQVEIICWNLDKYKVRIAKYGGSSPNVIALIEHIEVEASTVPLAICLAALAALGVKVE